MLFRSAQQGLAVAKIVAQVLERRSRGHHYQAAALADLVDCLLGIGDDETDAKDALETDWGVDGLFSLCRVLRVGCRRNGALLT